MMKHRKTGKALIACLFALVMLMAISATAVFAEEEPVTGSDKPVLTGDTFFVKDPLAEINIENVVPDNVSVKSVVSSKPKVLAVKKDINEDFGYRIIPKKKGSAKLTVRLKADGTDYKLKATYKILAYPKVIKSLKVNGKKIKVTASKNSYKTPKLKFKDGGVAVELAQKDGWNIDYAVMAVWNDDGEGDQIDVPVTAIQTGELVSIPDQYNNANMLVNMSKSTGPDFVYQIVLKR